LYNNYLSIKKQAFSYISISIFLILIAGLRPIGLDKDSNNYAYYIQLVTKPNFLDKEPAFWLIKWLNNIFFHGSIQSFFFIFAAIGVSIKIFAIEKLARIPWLSIIGYLSIFFILHEMTQIRVGIAAGIFLLAIPDIYNKDFKKFLIKTIFASFFHYSAIIMIPIYFINSKNISIKYIILPIVGMLFAYLNLSKMLLKILVYILPNILSTKINIYLSLLELGKNAKINVINFYYSSLLIILLVDYYILYKKKIAKSKYDFLFIKILSIMLFSFYFLSFVPTFSFRISEFLGIITIILLPNMVLYFKQQKILSLFIFSWFIIYFVKISLRLINLDI
jgi:hypothetical protein